jgi:hypothetical protein
VYNYASHYSPLHVAGPPSLRIRISRGKRTIELWILLRDHSKFRTHIFLSSIEISQLKTTIMAEPKSTANQRLTKITDFLTMNKTATTIPWDPDCTKFPTRKELPQIPGAPPEAAWVWGDSDYVSRTVNRSLLVEERLTKELRSVESTSSPRQEWQQQRKRSGLAKLSLSSMT